ncbi:fructokinase [Litorivivens lipolytica]|uniref:Fructokinase n=1 Tax=Litorivivens lipolytica TaxID=1524264 RepID=A0A7W4Z603_9GAMM|nr:ROK family protein [Litorivivens lipolytica]MBB3048034.1 fructokinase [Litorivivens lipolytica]
MRIGVDLGGTKIEAVVMDDHGSILTARRISTPVNQYPQTLQAIADLVQSLESDCGSPCLVGIGTPGSPQRNGLMKNCNSTVLNGKPLKADLEKRLQREIRMANDADCFALSEAMDGAGAGFETVFGVILGTGVGGGLVIHQRLLSGPNGLAGEWGHNPLPTSNEQRPCYCVKRDCIETHLNGAGLMSLVPTDQQKQCQSAADLSELALQGDAQAETILRLYASKLAQALATVINVVDPDVIVLGGGLSKIKPLYEWLPALLPEAVFGGECTTPVVPARYGDSSGVRGAAWLWPAGV